MLPNEQALLTEFRRRPSWSHFVRQRKADGVVVSPDAKIVLKAIDLLHSRGGENGVLKKPDLERAALSFAGRDTTPVRRAVDLLGEPTDGEASVQICWNILAQGTVARHLAQLVQTTGNGRLDPTTFRSAARDWQELDLLAQPGSDDRAPRPVHEALPKRGEEKGERLPTGLHQALDEAIGGGLRRGELAVVVAPSKHGKTSNLLRIATHLAGRGHRVLYLSFEIYLEQIVERLLTLVGGKKKNLPKTLYAEWYPAAKLDVERIIDIAQQVGKLDCLIVDYIELLNLDDDIVNAVGKALLKLRNYAHEQQAVVWTASQSDEPMPGAVYLRRDEIYGSRRKIHHADLIIGTLSIPQRRQLTYKLWGTRHGMMGAQFMSEADLVALKFRDL